MKIIVENAAEAQKALDYFGGSATAAAPTSHSVSAPPPPGASAPPPPAASAPPPPAAASAPPPPAAAAPVASAPVQPEPHGPAAPGWMASHVIDKVKEVSGMPNAAEAVTHILRKHNANSFPELNPARYHLVHEDIAKFQQGHPLSSI